MESLKRLSHIHSMADITSEPYKYVCPHCPLYMSKRVLQKIDGAYTVFLGVPECTFYISNIGRASEPGDFRFFSIVTDWQDVTFGAQKKIKAAFRELMEDYHPTAVFLVTSCILEITGDDIDSIAENLSTEYGIPVSVVHTEHFKMSGKSGIQNVCTACADLMREVSAHEEMSVNILGQDRADFSEQELSGILGKAGVSVRGFIPDTSIEELQNAAAASLNIVTDLYSVPLAEKMEELFGIPYALFLPHIDPDIMLRDYEDLFGKLGLLLPDEVLKRAKSAKRTVQSLAEMLEGRTYFAGQPFTMLYEFHAFLIRLGMVPLLIQTQEFGEEQAILSRILPEENAAMRCAVLEKADPYVVMDPEESTIEEYRKLLHPDMVIGLGARNKHEQTPCGFGGIDTFFSSLGAPTGDEHGPGKRGGERYPHKRHETHESRGTHERRGRR